MAIDPAIEGQSHRLFVSASADFSGAQLVLGHGDLKYDEAISSDAKLNMDGQDSWTVRGPQTVTCEFAPRKPKHATETLLREAMRASSFVYFWIVEVDLATKAPIAGSEGVWGKARATFGENTIPVTGIIETELRLTGDGDPFAAFTVPNA